MNQVTLMGNLTHDLELKTSKQKGIIYTRFTLAVARKGTRTNEADFFDIIAFSKQAEVLKEYMTKGRKLLVIGSLQNSTYTTEEGQKRTSTRIILEDFEFAGYRKEQLINQTEKIS